MSYLRRVDPSLLVLLGGAALLIPACTTLLGTFEIGDAGTTSTGTSTASSTGSATSTSGTGGTGGSGGAGGTGGDPTTSTGVSSSSTGTPLSASVLVPGPGKFAHINSVSSRLGIASVGGSFSGNVALGALGSTCPNAASCAFVGRFDFSQSGGGDAPWLLVLAGSDPTDTAEVLSVAVDSKGNTFAVGRYSGSLTIGGGSSLPKYVDGGLQHAFLLQLNKQSGPDWGLTNDLGGSSAITSVAVDAGDNPILAGDFTTKLKLGTCATLFVSQGATSSFVTKFNAATNGCYWSALLLGVDVKVHAVASDFGGNALVTGSHTAALNLIGGVALPKSASGGEDLFAAKLDTTQQGKPLWLRDIKSSKGAAGAGIAPVQGPNNTFGVMVTGKLDGTAFAGTPCAVTSTTPGASSLVARLDNASGDCVWSKSFAGESNGLSVDGSSDLVVAGSFVGSTNFDGSSLLTSGPGKAAFFTKLKSGAGELIWSRGLVVQNPGEAIAARSVSADASSGHWFAAGSLDGTTDFGIGPPLTATDGAFIFRLGN